MATINRSIDQSILSLALWFLLIVGGVLVIDSGGSGIDGGGSIDGGGGIDDGGGIAGSGVGTSQGLSRQPQTRTLWGTHRRHRQAADSADSTNVRSSGNVRWPISARQMPQPPIKSRRKSSETADSSGQAPRQIIGTKKNELPFGRLDVFNNNNNFLSLLCGCQSISTTTMNSMH